MSSQRSTSPQLTPRRTVHGCIGGELMAACADLDPVHDPEWTPSGMDTIPNEHLQLYSYFGV